MAILSSESEEPAFSIFAIGETFKDGVILSSKTHEPTFKQTEGGQNSAVLQFDEADAFVFDFGKGGNGSELIEAFSCDPDVTNIMDAAKDAGAVIVGIDMDHDGSIDAMMICADTMEFL